MTYKKTDDLLDLVIKMQSSREGVSLNEIAEQFNVSRRTAERMRNLIITRFPGQYEVRRDENGIKRWYIPQAHAEYIEISAEEISFLEMVKKMLRNKNMTDKVEILDRLIDKVKAQAMTKCTYKNVDVDASVLMEAEGFACRPGPKLRVNSEHIETIRRAILECHEINIKYFSRTKGETTRIQLRPCGFLYGERKHYLVAFHSSGRKNDGMPRTFILNNIKSVKVSRKTFVSDPDFDLQEYAAEAFGSYHEDPFDVEWLFDAETADEAAQYEFHPKQEMRRNDDGTLTVKFRAGGHLEMDWHLYTWGKHVKVIKPKNWKKIIAEYQM